MKKLKSVATALVVAGTVLLSGYGQAVNISQPAHSLALTSGSGLFGRVIDVNNSGNTFSDRYDFSAAVASSLAAQTSAISFSALDGIKITGFSLVNSGGLSLAGTQVLDGPVDQWTLNSSHLVPDSYYLLVSGQVLSAASTSYSGTVAVTAVPEPATYGMLLLGAGLLGAVARRRNNDGA